MALCPHAETHCWTMARSRFLVAALSVAALVAGSAPGTTRRARRPRGQGHARHADLRDQRTRLGPRGGHGAVGARTASPSRARRTTRSSRTITAARRSVRPGWRPRASAPRPGALPAERLLGGSVHGPRRPRPARHLPRGRRPSGPASGSRRPTSRSPSASGPGRSFPASRRFGSAAALTAATSRSPSPVGALRAVNNVALEAYLCRSSRRRCRRTGCRSAPRHRLSRRARTRSPSARRDPGSTSTRTLGARCTLGSRTSHRRRPRPYRPPPRRSSLPGSPGDDVLLLQLRRPHSVSA